MMAFTIKYQGLMCHLGDGADTTVFIAGPPEPKHSLRLVVQDPQDVIDAQCQEDKLFADQNGRSFIIAGRLLAVSGALPSVSTVSATFQNDVPALGHFAACQKLNDDVLNRKVTPAIIGYLTHPPGAFDVVQYFPKKAIIGAHHSPSRCVAKIVRLTLAVGDDPVTIAGGGVKIVLRPAATIEIHNTPDGAFGNANAHFHHYSAILDPKCQFHAHIVETNEDCQGQIPQFGNAECSNSHVP
jgi:hypothetical protein